jgi:hypothetical protein
VCTSYYANPYSAGPQSFVKTSVEAQALVAISDHLSDSLKNELRAPVSLAELSHALAGMKSGTSPGPDGVILEFFKEFWRLISGDYFDMITTAVREGRLPPSSTKGLIALLYKGGKRKKMTN